jgi:ankyrin repeat protein
MAVEFSNKSMVELLLSAGADPRLAMTLTDGKPGPSPYDLALALGDSSILELFNRKLGAGEKKPSKTDIPVSEAARDEKTVNSKEDFQDQGTHRAENNINGEHENEHSSASVENDDELNSIRWTWAVSFGDDLAVKRLLAQGISPNVVYWRRDSPNIMQEIEMEFSPPRSSDSYFEIYHHPALLLAVFDQNEKVVNVLLEAGADANCMDEEDYPSSQLVYGKCMVGPPLFIAVKKNNFNIAKMLIEHGAEVKDLYLPNLLQSIPAGERNKWINLLVVAGNNFSSTQSSSYNLNCRAGLFCDGATSPLKPKFEKTPPAWTLLLNHETAEPMIEKGLNVNSEFNGPCWSGTSSGSTLVPLQIPWTPLMIAASNCDDRLVDLLRKNGAKENGKDLGDLICAERNGDFVKKISLKFKLRNVPKKAPYFDPSRCVVLDTDKFPSIGSKK